MQTFALGRGAFTDYDSEWMPAERASGLMQRLTEELEWSQRPIVVFGKELMQPRLIAWGGDEAYKYSGQTLPPQEMPDFLRALMDEVSEAVGVSFNHVLLNRYRDGQDNMGMHADNEPELGKNPTIAAISLGVERWFVLMPKRKKANRFKKKFKLAHGSLLVMRGTMQHQWRHGLPKMGGVEGERINLTFRVLRGPPGWRSTD